MIYIICARLQGRRVQGLYTGIVEAADLALADRAAVQELYRLFGAAYTIDRSVVTAPRNADFSFGDSTPIVRNGAVMFKEHDD